MADEFDLELDQDAIDDLAADGEAQELAQEAGDMIADLAAAGAPKATGEGAASLHAEVDVDDQSAFADVSWERDHFYMYFHEVGTEHQPPRPFLRPALDQAKV